MLNGGKNKMSVKSCEKLEKSKVVLTIEVGAEEFEVAFNGCAVTSDCDEAFQGQAMAVNDDILDGLGIIHV